TAINVVAVRGVSQARLVVRLRAALHASGIEVITGKKAADEARTANAASLKFLSVFLMTFAVIALIVGSFVIYKPFPITAAPRTRETALLRAIGAQRRQVKRSLWVEAFVTGVVASAAGAAIGIGTTQVLRTLLVMFGFELSSNGVVVQPGMIVSSILT